MLGLNRADRRTRRIEEEDSVSGILSASAIKRVCGSTSSQIDTPNSRAILSFGAWNPKVLGILWTSLSPRLLPQIGRQSNTYPQGQFILRPATEEPWRQIPARENWLLKSPRIPSSGRLRDWRPSTPVWRAFPDSGRVTRRVVSSVVTFATRSAARYCGRGYRKHSARP